MLTYREYDSNPQTEDPKRHLYRLKQESQKEREYLGCKNKKRSAWNRVLKRMANRRTASSITA